jgi:hypothetical protein
MGNLPVILFTELRKRQATSLLHGTTIALHKIIVSTNLIQPKDMLAACMAACADS